MSDAKQTKTVKTIKINVDKCHGCRACEMICSAFHAEPKYSSNNPARARVRVVRHPLKDIYVPVYAGEYTPAECMGRGQYVVDGKEYEECAFCRASCPSRDAFKEPDSGLPLKCDMCESDPDLAEPMCVQWCLNDALIYDFYKGGYCFHCLCRSSVILLVLLGQSFNGIQYFVHAILVCK